MTARMYSGLLDRLRANFEPCANAPRLVYAGVGSRETPPAVRELMTELADVLGKRGYTLRTGGADGADDAFFRGAGMHGHPRELFVPWEGYNGHRPGTCPHSPDAYELARILHPAWRGCSEGARAMHARNGRIVLGTDLRAPADFVLCWTPDGATHRTSRATGGTGQAIRTAVCFNVPVWNLAVPAHLERWTRYRDHARTSR